MNFYTKLFNSFEFDFMKNDYKEIANRLEVPKLLS